MDEEVAERQAEITRLLIYYTQAPFAGTSCVRGVLPVPGAGESTRIVTGDERTHVPDGLTVYEIPLRAGEEFLHVYDVAAVLRAVHTGPYTAASVRVGRVLGMPLVQVDPSVAETVRESPGDRAFTILRTLVHPFTETEPVPRLLGFLCREPDLLRLYVDTEDTHGVLAVDVRPSGALTALLAALPSLITEEGRVAAEEADPHASYAVDLTYW
ncbi:hypothetical protein [Streptomyces spirodelae]|uniref:Uncharacterized protein n=1 Tax=Streptomyces spirodelae TaxID=2812904 RepID=A0ABS3WM00_9ACTN|nr:hypothetical protein [Streptomyces spirodelae]MBO8183921.1 hypothetical protein [Streptomyces spirodelae]